MQEQIQRKRIAVVGDIHGREGWKAIVAQEAWARIIFIGDYFDTHEGIGPAEQLHNFKEIVKFKRAHGQGVTLLVGNHDYHYLTSLSTERYAGWQRWAAADINQALTEAADFLQIATSEGDYLLTHAGVTEPWAARHGIGAASAESVVEPLNEAWRTRPDIFRFYEADYSGYGDHELQGPIWVRPEALEHAFAVPNQIVGHTTQQGVTQHGGLVFNDALGSGQFTIIEDNEIQVGRF